LKRAADLAEALYSMPRNTPSQLAGLPAPRSPASALNNAAAAAAMSAGFNAAYAASAGQLSCPSDQSLYHQNSQSNACSFERMREYTASHKPAPHVYCYVYNGTTYNLPNICTYFFYILSNLSLPSLILSNPILFTIYIEQLIVTDKHNSSTVSIIYFS